MYIHTIDLTMLVSGEIPIPNTLANCAFIFTHHSLLYLFPFPTLDFTFSYPLFPIDLVFIFLSLFL